MTSLHLKSDGRWTPLGFLKFWRPAAPWLSMDSTLAVPHTAALFELSKVTLLNETVHWGMKALSAVNPSLQDVCWSRAIRAKTHGGWVLLGVIIVHNED